MNVLAFDSSTDRLYLGLRVGAGQWVRDLPGGASASTHIIGELLDLMIEGGVALKDLDAIAFGAGPGSFTGLRTACAVAQGLAFGADLPVVAVPTLMAVAQDARTRTGATKVCAAVDARMNEVYFANYLFDSNKPNECFDQGAVGPEKLHRQVDFILAGNAHIAYPTRLRQEVLEGAILAAPNGAALLAVAEYLLTQGRTTPAQDARPVYVRDKVAQTQAERAEIKRAQIELAEVACEAARVAG